MSNVSNDNSIVNMNVNLNNCNNIYDKVLFRTYYLEACRLILISFNISQVFGQEYQHVHLVGFEQGPFGCYNVAQ